MFGQRKEGQTGGSAYNKKNRATYASAVVHQKAGKGGGSKPPKKPGCPLGGLIILALGAAGFAAGYWAAAIFA